MRTVALFVLVLAASCSDPVPPPIERAEVSVPSPASTPREDMLRERAGKQRILSDARDAWMIPIGESASIELAPSTDPRFDSAACVVIASGGPRTGRVKLETRLEGSTDLEWSTEVDLADIDATWREVGISIHDGTRGGELRIAASWVGAVPAGAEHVRAAFEVPRRARLVPDPSTKSPNVLIVTIDTLRADRLGCYGYARPTSPNLDALAARGVRFESAYSSAPWTLPSYGSLFTGLLPGEHRAGVVTERDALFALDQDAPAKTTTEVLRADVETLAEKFAEAGFTTAMFHNNPYLSRATGLERGFQRYVRYESNARNGVDIALAWTKHAGTAPWFLVLHLMDPHYPYAPPAPFDDRFAARSVEAIPEWPPNLATLRAGRPTDEIVDLSSNLYDGEIAFTDQEIGRLLDELEKRGSLANTIVVIHSDHGEEFWEHGSCDHGHAQHEELLRVPLIVVQPGHVPANRVVESRVRALDLFATLLDLAGIPARTDIESRSMRPLFAGTEGPRRTFAEAIHGGAREIKVVIEGTLKLVQRGTDVQLHDLAVDPGCARDLSSSEAQHVEALRALLLGHHGRSREAAKRAKGLEFDAATKTQIENLGYTGAGGGARK